MRPGESPLARHLRAATAPAHEALDHHALLAPLVTDALDEAAYGRALAALHAPQARLEAEVAGAIDALAPGYGFTRRVADLRADLAALGREPSDDSGIRTPGLATPAGLVGALYVLEGSRFGGAMIARHVRRVLGEDTPVRFFAGDGVGRHWRAFWDLADGLCGPADHAPAAAAAEAAFEAFRAHLDRCAEPADLPG